MNAIPLTSFRALGRRLGLLCLTALAGLLLGPASASAYDPAVDMYAEFVPRPNGDKPTKQLDFGNKTSNLPVAIRKDLGRRGATGQEVERLLALTDGAPIRPGTVSDRGTVPVSGSGQGTVGRSTGESGRAPSLQSVIGEGFVRGSGLGFALPVLSLLIACFAVLMAVMRRRTSG